MPCPLRSAGRWEASSAPLRSAPQLLRPCRCTPAFLGQAVDCAETDTQTCNVLFNTYCQSRVSAEPPKLYILMSPERCVLPDFKAGSDLWAVQVAGLYYVGLLVCCAAFVGYTAFGLALCQVGVPAGLVLHPAGFAASAMVAMTSPLFLAFLPLMLPVRNSLSQELWTEMYYA